jgi:hypothetical protein
MMKSYALSLAAVISFSILLCAQSVTAPPNLVPDAETAVAIAKVVLKPIYGRDFVNRKGFTAIERDGIWVVIGKSRLKPDKIAYGGTVEVRLSATDAKILYLHLGL